MSRKLLIFFGIERILFRKLLANALSIGLILTRENFLSIYNEHKRSRILCVVVEFGDYYRNFVESEVT